MANQYKTMVLFNGTALQNTNLNTTILNANSKSITLNINNTLGTAVVNFNWRECFTGNNTAYMVEHDYKNTVSAERANVINAIKTILSNLRFNSGEVVLFAYQGSEKYL